MRIRRSTRTSIKGLGFRKQQRDIGGQHGQQINHAKKTAHITPGVRSTRQPQQIFGGKQQRKSPLQPKEQLTMAYLQRLHAIGNHHQHAEQNGDNQADIKPAPGTVSASKTIVYKRRRQPLRLGTKADSERVTHSSC
jgi:hypothetical protein